MKYAALVSTRNLSDSGQATQCPGVQDAVSIVRPDRARIGEIGLKPLVGKVFPAADVAQAHRFLETKQATGKVLLAW